MSTTIALNQKQLNKNEKLQLHFLPAKVDGDGEANVNEYFNNYTREENGTLINALRGYPLNGHSIAIPKQYRGIVLQEPQNNEDNEFRKLQITGTFDEFTYWNYDKVPSKADHYLSALEWSDIASSLSATIDESDVMKEMESHKSAGAKEN